MVKKLRGISFAICAVFLLLGCHKLTVEELKQKIVGNWREVRTKNEFLDFKADGTGGMQSPTTNDTCDYDFPDPEHLRLNCAPQGAPPRYQVWKLDFKGDQLLISDGGEVGTYRRQ